MDTLAAKADTQIAARVFKLCLRDATSPLGYGHIAAISQLMDASIGNAELHTLECAYSVAIAQAFLVDDLHDGQTDDTAVASLLPTMKSIEISLLSDAIPAQSLRRVIRRILQGSQDQVTALQEEQISWRVPDAHHPRNMHHVTNRSAAVVTYLTIIDLYAEKDFLHEAKPIIEEFIKIVQYCDDASDWETDFQSGRITPLLSKILRNPKLEGLSAEQTQQQLARSMYLNGGLLDELQQLFERLDQLCLMVDQVAPHAILFKRYATHQQELVRKNILSIEKNMAERE